MRGIVQDVRFTVRLIGRDRWFSAAAIVSLALGIGVNAAGFTIVNGAFLRGLPFERPDRLFVLTWQTRANRRANLSPAEFEEWRSESRSFQDLAAWRSGPMNLSDDRNAPEELRGASITPGTFDQLRQTPILGRDFTASDAPAAADPVAIISHRTWQRRYAGDTNVPGTVVRINGQPFTVIGVMPEAMRFPDDTDVWTPLVPAAGEPRTARTLAVFGRLRDGVSAREALTEMNGIATRSIAAHAPGSEDLVGARIETFTERFVGGPARVMFMALMGAVSFVLLIVCANVANLLLSRSANRAREVALRLAMGATRWRVVRQLLIESVVLSAGGGLLGLLMAQSLASVIDAAMADPGRPFWIAFTIDWVVVAYVATICILTAMSFGLAPALHVSRANSHDLLKEGGRGGAGSRRVRAFSGAIVVAELALTMVLLAGAGLMLRSVLNLRVLDLGFDTTSLMTMRMRLGEPLYGGADARRAFFDRLEPRLAAIPGMESVAVTTGVPPTDGGERLLEVDLPADRSAAPARFVSVVAVTPSFFDVLRTPLLGGRSFDARDGTPGVETVIVNQRLASAFFGADNPLGRRLRFTVRDPKPGEPPQAWRTIVGVAPPIRYGSPEDRYENAVVFVPYRQDAPASTALLLRSRVPAASVMDAVRREVQAIDRDQPVLSLQTVEQALAETQWPYRVFGALFSLFGAIAIVLSSLGLYAVMAYSVSQRTQEIGVRMAVGAAAPHVWWLILRRGLAQLGLGLAIGLPGALALSGVLRRMLVGISPADPITYVAITVLLAVVSIAACLVPAWRATRVDPVVTLRAS